MHLLFHRLGRSSGRGHGNPLQYSFLENPMDRGAWQATVHEVAKIQSWLKWLSTQLIRMWQDAKKIQMHCRCGLNILTPEFCTKTHVGWSHPCSSHHGNSYTCPLLPPSLATHLRTVTSSSHLESLSHNMNFPSIHAVGDAVSPRTYWKPRF